MAWNGHDASAKKLTPSQPGSEAESEEEEEAAAPAPKTATAAAAARRPAAQIDEGPEEAGEEEGEKIKDACKFLDAFDSDGDSD